MTNYVNEVKLQIPFDPETALEVQAQTDELSRRMLETIDTFVGEMIQSGKMVQTYSVGAAAYCALKFIRDVLPEDTEEDMRRTLLMRGFTDTYVFNDPNFQEVAKAMFFNANRPVGSA